MMLYRDQVFDEERNEELASLLGNGDVTITLSL